MDITTVGLDLAKNVFHVVCCNRAGKVIKRKKLRRAQVVRYFTQLPPCLVGMEACTGAHYWARKFKQIGHDARLISPQHVTPYVGGQKNDYNDASAIAEAVTRPRVCFVAIKTPQQQEIQALHRLRKGRLKERTALCNQLRGLLSEHGLVIPKGVSKLRKRLPEILEACENGLSDRFRRWLAESYCQLEELDGRIQYYTNEIEAQSCNDEACNRLRSIPGFGPIVSSAYANHVGNGSGYRRGRDVSASIGLIPRQHSSGGKSVLLGITRRGNSYLRGVLIHGARAVVQQAGKKEDRFSRWVIRVRERRGFNKATVAVANKLARIGWAVLHNQTVYQTGQV